MGFDRPQGICIYNKFEKVFFSKPLMRKHDLFSSIIWCLVGLFIVLYSPRFGIGSLRAPESGFMPLLAGAAMCIFSAVTFVHALQRRRDKIEKIWENVPVSSILFVFMMLCIYALSLEQLGFLIATFLLILILSRFPGGHRWRTCLLVSGIAVALSYLLLQICFKAQLPRGFLGI